MAIVSCPECGKKLKIADTSVGKKVKGPCGHVFVAQDGEPAPALAVPSAVAAEKVYVACTECGAKLKVATTSLGKKMKCPKCAAAFIASLPDEAPVQEPKAKAKPAVSEDDMDDLLAFAQADANGKSETADEDLFKNEPVKSRAQRKRDEEEEADDEPMPKGKGKPRSMDDDDDEPMPKGKPGKSPRVGEAEEPARPVYPSMLVPNILVTLMLLAFGGLVGAVFFDINLAKELGLPDTKIPTKVHASDPEVLKAKEKEVRVAEEANKKELALFDGTWVVESPEALKGQKFIFAGDKVTAPDLTGDFSVETQLSPRHINLHGALGIYEFTGETLKIAIPREKQAPPKMGKKGPHPPARPKSFDAPSALVIVLTREKPGDAPPPKKPDEPKKSDEPKDKGEPKAKDAGKEKDEKKDKEPSPEEKEAAARDQIKVLTTAAQAYYIKNKTWPASLEDLAEKDALGNGPYVKSKDDLRDPWGRPFNYDLNGKGNNSARPDIWTVAPNNQLIGNWPEKMDQAK